MRKRRMCMITVRRPTRTTKRMSERIWHPAGGIADPILPAGLFKWHLINCSKTQNLPFMALFMQGEVEERSGL
jgi:hypothetical protein